MFPVTSKMVSPNSMNFHTEVALNMIFKAKCFTCNAEDFSAPIGVSVVTFCVHFHVGKVFCVNES